MTDFDTTYDRLDCPHIGSCSCAEPLWSISEATHRGKLTLEVECNNCSGTDHLMFDVEKYDRSDTVSFEVGDEFTLTDSIQGLYRLEEGDKGLVTAIADNPLYDQEKVVVGVIFQIDQTAPYLGHLFHRDQFTTLVGDSVIFD